MVKFFSLSSGSNANCYYIGNEETALLIDCGLGPRTVKKRLLEHNIDIKNIEFILVTHNHIDHIKGVGILSEIYSLPVYATEKLHLALDNHSCTRCRLKGSARKTKLGEVTEYKGVAFIPFEVPHDATQTVGYFINFYGIKFTFVTDVGAITEELIHYCKMCDVLIFESNYCLDMLLSGPYSPELKQRIIQGHGHLSNEQAAFALKQIYTPKIKSIFLCHLSENNNTPDKALKVSSQALSSIGVNVGTDVQLVTLPRRECSPLYRF